MAQRADLSGAAFGKITAVYGHVDKNEHAIRKWLARKMAIKSSPNLCVNYFFSRALVVQGMPLHPCLCTSTLEGAVKGAPLRTSKRFP